MVSIQPSAVSRQPSAVSRGQKAHAKRTADVTQHYSNAYLLYSKADSTSISVAVGQ
ncbi:MAG: hypothetical protein F6K56_28365 [Moorea sp. SIO3G5]|nr:hypothetical protein [Moorena sp. SIO3G5]